LNKVTMTVREWAFREATEEHKNRVFSVTGKTQLPLELLV